ncbi:uncharacterized protein Z520_07263 [Fonsecaea multimorphosa CBS 102226]|uniref:BTB domain-containing protein n=1 Tax=Fonsecaea multimorphosa CBS 102226 TaxID=1442371 RepID=A0A0D2K271_9EURO|nr:uncharacterized protein Z520_07263 [Fonsecaea multimorphosa CBS 102226]KIX97149.1 hypothetical protein Z520_07263 [Fonsecaea multimorphosa CBS 102226]OAL22923.1 hypothetical protein AYO22_06831 [Fonsecaea multimorphosa]
MSSEIPSSVLVQLMQSGDFSDLKFLCNGEEFKVHKAIVCTQSPVIKAATEGSFEESRTNVIKMDNFDPRVVRQLVQFIYTGDYEVDGDQHVTPDQGTCEGVSDKVEEGTLSKSQAPPDEDQPNSTSSSLPTASDAGAADPLLQHIRVNSIGDYYGVERLVSLANRKIKCLHKDANDKSWVGCLPAAIEAASQSTGDHQVQEILAEATAENLPTLLFSTLLVSDRFKSLSLFTDFSIRVLEYCALNNKTLKYKLATAHSSHAETQKQVKIREMEIEKLKECMRVLNKTSECRNCAAEFKCTIDPNERLLRCAKCMCKHY